MSIQSHQHLNSADNATLQTSTVTETPLLPLVHFVDLSNGNGQTLSRIVLYVKCRIVHAYSFIHVVLGAVTACIMSLATASHTYTSGMLWISLPEYVPLLFFVKLFENCFSLENYLQCCIAAIAT